MEMKYCMQCGTLLHIKEHPTEGPTPYCDCCEAYRYPVFNTAVSMIVTNLVAGYVNKGEDAEDAAVREVMEEIGLTVHRVHFNRSHYYARSNTLMLNFTVTVDDTEAHPNWEVEDWSWFSVEEARQKIRPSSLAAVFLNGYFDGEYHFENFLPDSYR